MPKTDPSESKTHNSMLKEEQTLKKKESLEKFISSKSMYKFATNRPLLGSC